jgi:pimeloyl-ACP methyl ester carboxylesterase
MLKNYIYNYKDIKVAYYSNVSEDTKNTKARLVFLHGIASLAWHWNPIIRYLKDDYEIYVLDRPGYGNSDNPVFKTLDESVDLVIRFCEEVIRDSNICLVGHSFGGVISQLCIKKKKIFDSAILISSFIRFRVNENIIQNLYKGKYSNELVYMGFSKSTELQYVDDFSESVQSINKESILNELLLVDGCNLKNEIDGIEIPVLLISSGEDRVVSKRQVMLLDKLIMNSDLLVIKGAGHNVMYEKPKELSKILDNFILCK